MSAVVRTKPLGLLFSLKSGYTSKYMAKKTTSKVSVRAKSGMELVPGAQFILLLVVGIALVVGLLYMQQPQDIRNQAKELGVDQLVPLQ